VTATAPDDDRATDRALLAEVVKAYARHADQRQFDALIELFAADGELAMHRGDPNTTAPDRVRHGRTEIATAMQTLRRYTVTHHMLGQHTVWFDTTERDRASGETYCLASHVRPGAKPDDAATMRVMAIRYFDDFVRESGTWRIGRRRLAIDWIDEHTMG
jgi:hypothetical protein